MDVSIQMALNPSHQLTEGIIHQCQVPDLVGDRWRDLARALEFYQAVIDAIQKEQGSSTKECCIAILVRWIGREGRDATVEKLAEALIKIELKNLAEKLMCIDTKQIDKFNKAIIDLQEEGSKMRLNIKELKEKLSSTRQKYQHAEQECSVLRARNLELEKDLATERQQHQNASQEGSEMRTRIQQLIEQLQDSEQECSKLRTKIFELEEDLTNERQQHQAISRESVDSFVYDGTKGVSDETVRDVLYTDQETRERPIFIRLENLNEKLKTNVTSLLQIPEVKEDKLKTAVKLDLLTKLSMSLQDMYSEIHAMAAETCKCSEDLRREYYDLAYHGLRAEHNDLIPRVEDLESFQPEMSDEEKKNFERLKQYQINRQRQVDRLENLWRGLFSPERHLEATSSVPSGGDAGNSAKTARRNYTDPGAKEKQGKPSSAKDDDKCEVHITTFKKSSAKKFFGRKESKDNMCFPVSYTHRDS